MDEPSSRCRAGQRQRVARRDGAEAGRGGARRAGRGGGRRPRTSRPRPWMIHQARRLGPVEGRGGLLRGVTRPSPDEGAVTPFTIYLTTLHFFFQLNVTARTSEAA